MIKHMKRCIFTKVKFMALFLFAALMAACTADVYEPKPDPTPTPEDGAQSPAPDATASPDAVSSPAINFSIPDLTPSPTPQAE